MAKALIFDCDGVLADTERDGHLVAFNQLFAEVGLPFHWSDADYAELVKIGGGKERIASVLTPELATQLGIDQPAAAIAKWHQRKTAIYLELLETGRIPARPGVLRLTAEAIEAGWLVAVASTSAEASVRAVLQHAVGEELAPKVRVYAGDIVKAKKPAPDIYAYTLRDLDLPERSAAVIEDSGIGSQAAQAAGIRPVITVSSYTADDDFTGAAVVLNNLGELHDPAVVLSRPSPPGWAGLVDLALLDRLGH